MELLKYLDMEKIKLIKIYLKKCINNGFLFWPFHFSFEQFIIYLNKLEFINKIYIWKGRNYGNWKAKSLSRIKFPWCINFFNKQTRTMISYVCYKTTSKHLCLPYINAQTLLIKTNNPHNLANRIYQCLPHVLLQLKIVLEEFGKLFNRLWLTREHYK